MSKPRRGPNRRMILAVALATACVPAVVVGLDIGSLGAGGPPDAGAEPAVTAAAGPSPVPVPVTPTVAPVTALPWADVVPVPTRPPAAVAPPVAEPVHVSLARLGIASDLMRLGMNRNGTVEVPPSARHAPAGWYDGSSRPGEVGAAVVLGHVDSVYGPGVFYRLRHTRAGDRIVVRRADGTSADFTVERVATYPRPRSPRGRFTARSTTGVAPDHLRRAVHQGRGRLPVERRRLRVDDDRLTGPGRQTATLGVAWQPGLRTLVGFGVSTRREEGCCPNRRRPITSCCRPPPTCSTGTWSPSTRPPPP